MAKYEQDPSFSTKAIHEGNDPDQWKCRAVVPLISLSTTFKQEAPGVHAGFEYARSGNPTRNCLETCLASLEQVIWQFGSSV
jgi:cystathionine gamma-lyase